MVLDWNKITTTEAISKNMCSLKSFMMKHNKKVDTMVEADLKKLYDLPIYPRDSEITTNKGSVVFNTGSMGGPQWVCFSITDKKSYFFHSLGGPLEEFFLTQLSKTIIFHIFFFQVINSKNCGTFCLYTLCLIERMGYSKAVLKVFF